MTKQFLDASHPMFRKAWVRWATTLFPLGWGALELYWGNPGWAAIFGGAGAYAGYILLVKKAG